MSVLPVELGPKNTFAPQPHKASTVLPPLSAAKFARLPVELFVKICSDDVLSKKEVAGLRSLNHWHKRAIDDAVLPQFRLPSTSLTSPRIHQKATVATFLHQRLSGHARMVAGRYARVTFSLGNSSVLLTASPTTMLLRCGNGRLLAAELHARGSVMTQLAPGGALAPTETLLAAVQGRKPSPFWRLVTTRSDTNAHYLFTFRPYQAALRHALPESLRPFDQHGLQAPCPLVFSASGAYLVEQDRTVARRYFLGDGALPPTCVDTLLTQGRASLCASSGRRFVFQGGAAQTIFIFRNAVCAEVLQQFTLQEPAHQVIGVSICPDGSHFALARSWMDDLHHQYAAPVRVASVGRYTYEVPPNHRSQIQCKSAQIIRLDTQAAAAHVAQGSWFDHPQLGWQFVRRELIRTSRFDCHTSRRFGIEDADGLTSLTASKASPWPITALVWRSGLAPAYGREGEPSLSVSRGQKARYRIDQATVHENATLYLVIGSLLFLCVTLPMVNKASNEQRTLFACGYALAVGVFYARRWCLQRQADNNDNRPDNYAIDLQSAALPLTASGGEASLGGP